MKLPIIEDNKELDSEQMFASRHGEASSKLKNVNVTSKEKKSSLSCSLPNSEVDFPSTFKPNLSTSLSDHNNQSSIELNVPPSPFSSCASDMVPSSERNSLKEHFLSSVQIHTDFEAPKKPSSMKQSTSEFSLGRHSLVKRRQVESPKSTNQDTTSVTRNTPFESSLSEMELERITVSSRMTGETSSHHGILSFHDSTSSVQQRSLRKNSVSFSAHTTTSDTHKRRKYKRKSMSFGTSSSLDSSNSNIKCKRRNSIQAGSSFLLSESGSITNIIPLGTGLTRTKSLLNEEFSLASNSISSRNDSSSKGFSFSVPLEIKAPQRSIVNEKDDTTMAIVQCDNDQWIEEETAKFDSTLDKSKNFNCDAKNLLKKTRSVSVLARRLLLAESEAECYEIVGRLMISLFGVGRCTYALMIDADNYILKEFSVQDQYLKEIISLSNGEDPIEVFPLSGGLIEECALNLDALYFPDTRNSTYFEHEQMHQFGLRTALTVPILVGARKFAGAFTVALSTANAFTEMDIILIKDIAHSLGAHLYSKRLQEEQTESYNVSRELLHSMIPGPVLEKIEQHWECTDDDGNETTLDEPKSNKNQDHDMEDSKAKKTLDQTKERLEKLHIIRKDKNDLYNLGHTRHTTEFKSEISSESSPVLFAETQSNVSIIFTDIVGFSRISRHLKPIQVMQMLQDLYHKFDLLCEKHGVRKLETIGDAYIVSAGLLEGDTKNDEGKDAAKRCLAMAQDMVREAQNVFAPTEPKERLTLRAGIHVGQLSYGVLGQNVPKFSVYGDAVNIAARMEQTCPVGMVHVSGAFHKLIGDDVVTWQEKRMTKVKNIGELETWLLNPMRVCTRKSNSGRRWLHMLRSESGKHWVA
ncbi:hypothetical protein CTEN210_16536 [Chaetoceros tenuissimus]|uniref:Guanylate cyclase domain-containing protein n=1 Tax=Chaetoceros tenuissimus TaxID=426638 RepID=A0AAD3DAZ8_9STRA|nr:hypothetical protein CTEN210_16536 [Chaetoceros tenuissimus]